ncbi:serine hydrolase domain-containing protein [Spongiimicrobium salis]|uniref:serine hydrolase domain-containing protein n=1 Tax=Spongiimicrobium salis TaxID=1667022 RepID=UPI00374C8BD7
MRKFKLNKTGRRICRILGVIFLLLVLFNIYYAFTLNPFPQESLPLTETIYDSAYEAEISRARRHLKNVSKRLQVPSFSIAVGHQNKIIWSAAEGYQDMESRTIATPQTQYRIGSTSKSLTATGVANAFQKKQLFMDASIGDTIINWKRKQWDFSMRQLLSHTAGFGNYGDFGMSSWKYTLCNCYEFNTVTEGLNVFNTTDLLYEPGTDFAYSTFDINFASAVLEQATGMPFPKYMEQEIFTPLGMKHTYADHTRPKSEHFATFYETDNGYYREFRSFGFRYDINLSYKWAGGGFISTPSDLVRLGNAWVNDTTFIHTNTKKEFWKPVKLKNGEINEQQYALGWRSYLDFNYEHLGDGETSYWVVHHGGVSKGSQNFLVLFPNYNLVIDASINANVMPFSKFFAEVMQIATPFLESLEKEESQLFLDIKEVQ